MQRYRVNYKLLIILVVGAAVVGAGWYGLWWVQRNRSADKLLELAKIEKEKDTLEAVRNAANYLRRYTMLEKDDEQGAEDMALAYASIAEREDAEPVDRRNALAVLETTVRTQPTNDDLRRRLVDLNMEYGLWNDAIAHLAIMVNDDPTNTELLGLLATSYFRAQQDDAGMEHYSQMVGYDQRTGKFDDEKATAPGVVIAYRYLAACIRRNSGDPALADRVIEKMVERNPDTADAYVNRGQYRLSLPENEGMEEAGVADIDRALEQDPTNADAILAKASLLIKNEEYDKARQLLEEGLGRHPENARMYRSIAYLVARQEGFEASLEWYRKGIAQTDNFERLDLQFAMARALINANKLDEAKETIATLKEEVFFPKPYLDFLEARLLVTEQKWYPASEALKQVRPTLTGNLELSLELNMMLCICYERLDQWEQLIEAATRARQLDPSNGPAEDFLVRAKDMLGQVPIGADSSLEALITKELRKPRDQIDLEGLLEKVDKYAETSELPEPRLKLLKAEVHARAGDYDAATRLVRESIELDDDNMNTWRMIVKLTASDPNQGAAVAMDRLDRVVEKFGEHPLLRLDRADLLIQLNGENVSPQLMAIADGTEDWPKAERVQLWQGLVDRFQAIRDSESRERAMIELAEIAPNELSNLLELFMAARAEDDDARMADAQEKILKVVGSKSNATWAFTEANRLISLYRRDLVDESALQEAENLVVRAMDSRPDWHQLHLTLSDLALARTDKSAALAHLDRAAALGPPSVISLIQHVTLLMEARRYEDARKQIERATENVRQRLLGRQYAEVLLNTRSAEQAVEVADKVRELAGDNGSIQLWYGRFALQAAQSPNLPEARRDDVQEAGGAALAKAVELEPGSADSWVALIQHLAATDQKDQASQAVRDLQLAMEEDEAPLVVAAAYEMLGRWFDAENKYLLAQELRPDDVRVTRALAAFYLGPRYPLDDGQRKAVPLVNELLRLSAEKPDQIPQPYAFWARRTAAKLLAQTGDYQKALDAERLLASNVVDGQMVDEDKLLMAQILARRPESVSKLKAIQLYESLKMRVPLPPQDGLMLGQLYFAVDRWNDCQTQMLEVISNSEDREKAAALEAYAAMLLSRGEPRDVKNAARWLQELQKLAPTNPRTLELLVQLFSQQGRQEDVAAYLRRLMERKENQEDPLFAARVAELLAEAGDLATAEQLFRRAATVEPRLNTYLAQFLGMHRDMDHALDLLGRQRETIGDAAAIQRALSLLRAKRETVGDRYDRRVQDWIDKALVVNPDSVRLKMQKGEFLDIQQKYAQAAQAYRKVLDLPELNGITRAIVLNNLAYLVALSSDQSSDLKEAIGYVQESIEISGPRSDILDTRAVVHMAMGDHKAAVRDLELAVTDGPSASKYFHKTRAHLLAGQRTEAVKAWDRAVALGLTREKVAIAERDAYDDVKSQIDGLRTRSAARRADS